MKVKIIFILILTFFFLSFCYAQNLITEYSNFECSHSKLITVPFSKNPKTGETKIGITINQTVFYEHRDQFSYWYKIPINANGVISCKIKPINEKDVYVIYVYKYNKEDFCNKVFYGKLEPLKSSKFLNEQPDKENFEYTEIKLKVKEGEAYYFCVLNVSLTNCGHEMQLVNDIDTFNVKAIHLPCSEEDETPVFKKNSNVDSIVNELSSEKKYQIITINVIDEYNKSKKVEAQIKIKDELTGNEIQIKANAKTTKGEDKSSYTLKIEKGRYYKIDALAMGYKRFDHSIIISEYVHPDSSNFNIYLRPLKTGDNFVMNNIYFFPNTYALKRESEKEIAYLYNYLQNNPEVKIELEGHTNGNNKISKNRAYKSKGPEWNFKGTSKKLSVYRAECIKKMLIKKGIAQERIKTVGYGGDRMIVPNAASKEALDKNIRVEVKIL